MFKFKSIYDNLFGNYHGSETEKDRADRMNYRNTDRCHGAYQAHKKRVRRKMAKASKRRNRAA